MTKYLLLALSLFLGVAKNLIPKAGEKAFTGINGLMNVNIVTSLLALLVFSAGGYSLLLISDSKFIIMAIAINSTNFQELSSSDQLVVIDFWAPWCGPCRALTPIIEELAEEYEGKAIIGKCDTDENNDIAIQFGVRNIPMLVFLKNGEVKDVLVGLVKKGEIEEKIKQFI